MSIVKGIALITGSAQGLGRTIALRLAKDGFDIALNDVSAKRDQLRAVANDIEKIGRRTHLVPADVVIEGEVKGMVQDVSKALGGLDVVSKCRTSINHAPGIEYILRRWWRTRAYFECHPWSPVGHSRKRPAAWTDTMVFCSQLRGVGASHGCQCARPFLMLQVCSTTND